ncbi:MAG: anti-anti-sigma factor [Acidiferrobacteraceae bacterium]|nr:anti-anti-sigma factor [Acidiferrobacteraceae bacterium]|tara:strand:- start:1982 stop:2278 length:297 start_codon:yes stop_codon:yes gene_type:complete
MSQIRRTYEDHWHFEGELSFETVCEILPKCPEIEADKTVTVDLSGATLVDSAGLSLLIEWRRLAENKGGVIRYINLSSSLSRLFNYAGLDFLLVGNDS